MKAPHLCLTAMAPFALAALAALGCFACKNGGEASASTTGTSNGSSALSGAAMSVNITANEKGFTPSSFELKKGAPATLIFRRTSDATCATQVVFPELKITKDLPLNLPVPIEVPTGEERTLVFQCGMGMFKGKAIIH